MEFFGSVRSSNPVSLKGLLMDYDSTDADLTDHYYDMLDDQRVSELDRAFHALERAAAIMGCCDHKTLLVVYVPGVIYAGHSEDTEELSDHLKYTLKKGLPPVSVKALKALRDVLIDALRERPTASTDTGKGT